MIAPALVPDGATGLTRCVVLRCNQGRQPGGRAHACRALKPPRSCPWTLSRLPGTAGANQRPFMRDFITLTLSTQVTLEHSSADAPCRCPATVHKLFFRGCFGKYPCSKDGTSH